MIVGDPEGDHAVLDPADGARMTGLVLGGHALLVPFAGQEPMWWGAFVMAPWTSLLREGVDRDGLSFAPVGDAAWHGVVRDVPWRAVPGGLTTDLQWPFGGTATLAAQVEPGELRLRLAVTAGERGMPAAVGWHPWFRRELGGAEAELAVPADALVQERDAAGVPTGGWTAPTGPWNDGVRTGPVELRYPGVGTLRVSWDAPWAILFATHPQGVCIEPTTSPAERMDAELAPGESLSLEIRVVWTAA